MTRESATKDFPCERSRMEVSGLYASLTHRGKFNTILNSTRSWKPNQIASQIFTYPTVAVWFPSWLQVRINYSKLSPYNPNKHRFRTKHSAGLDKFVSRNKFNLFKLDSLASVFHQRKSYKNKFSIYSAKKSFDFAWQTFS